MVVIISIILILVLSIKGANLLSNKITYDDWHKGYHSFYHSQAERLTHIDEINYRGEELPKFSFDQFLQFYKLNPEHWIITSAYSDEGLYPCRLPLRWERSEKNYFDINYYPIGFTNAKEYSRYRAWAQDEVENNKNKNYDSAQMKNTKIICDLVQQDIDNIRKEALENCEQAAAYSIEIIGKL